MPYRERKHSPFQDKYCSLQYAIESLLKGLWQGTGSNASQKKRSELIKQATESHVDPQLSVTVLRKELSDKYLFLVIQRPDGDLSLE